MKRKSLKNKTIISSLSIFFQNGYSAILGFLAQVIITWKLTPTEYGTYYIVLSSVVFLNYFSDIGLGAALIQKKEDLDEDDLKTTFTVQQSLVIFLITIGFLFTPFIQQWYDLPIAGVHIYWALIFGFFISSLKTIPSILLERELLFQKIVLVQIIENTFFYLIVIVLIFCNFRLESFAIAILTRSFIGLIVMSYIRWWNFKIGISKQSLKNLLSFGLPFQASSFLALIKDDFILLYVAGILGPASMGYIGWAKKWAETPLKLTTDAITRVFFPLFARLQDEKETVSILVEKIIYYQTLIIIPFIFTLNTILAYAVKLLSQYNKWEKALPYLFIICIASFFVSYSVLMMSIFSALGKAKEKMYFMILWTFIMWIFAGFGSHLFRDYGLPIALLAVSLTSFYVIFYSKKFITFSFFKNVISGFTSGLFSVFIFILFWTFAKPSFLNAISCTIIQNIIYISILILIFKIKPKAFFKKIISRDFLN